MGLARYATLSAPPAAAAEAAAPSPFAAFERRLGAGPGCVIVRTPSAPVGRAYAAHAARRLAAAGLRVFHVARPGAVPAFRDLAYRLGLTGPIGSASECAERLASALRGARGAVVGELPAVDTWDRGVVAELARAGVQLVLTTEEPAGDDVPGELIEIGTELVGDDRRRFAEGLAEDVLAHAAADDVAALDEFWRNAKSAAPRPALEGPAATLLARLVAAGRSWPRAEITRLGSAAAAAELIARGSVRDEGGFLTAAEAAPASVAADAPLIAEALVETFPGDPWALAQSACLRIQGGTVATAHEAFERALRLVAVDARRELIRTWVRAADELGAAARAPLLATAATAALDTGDAQEALRLARLAWTADASDDSLAVLVGRAALATGDLGIARAALEQARQRGETPAVLVELAELSYLAGDHAGAEAMATRAEASADARIKLAARSVRGKLLLAASQHEAAERHFAEDAVAASLHGLGTPSRRARLNRSIALMLRGQLHEAKALLDDVRREGSEAGDVQAQAYALENLSGLALREREYGSALRFADEAFVLRRWQGDRLRMVRLLVSLAAMRRALGLFDHARHAILFGRRVLGPGTSVDAAPDFGLIAARIALDCGRADEAVREAKRALVEGETARDRVRVLGEAHRLLARAALEDGDVSRAKASLASAEALGGDDDARWEVVFIGALVARAEGTLTKVDVERVLSSLSPDYEWDNEYERASYVLAAEVERSAGDPMAARAYLERAIALRDRVLRSLDGESREAFSRRGDVAQLERLARECETLAIQDEAPATRRVLPASTAATARELVGEDPTMRTLKAAIRRVANSGATVLVRGESGTGKELVAEALHRASDRASGPLVTVNCAALVETLLLSELFGHEKGAFTGAAARRRGRFELAEGGTLFLDEIGDISPRTQVALLRVLQEKTFERVGGTTAIKANVRVVCATHRDLRAMVERGEFREDLYYRLRGITLEVPALRARLGDLPAIATNLLARIADERSEAPKSLTPAAIELLQRHRWPGNVRELENALRAASLFADGSAIDARELAENVDDLRSLGPAATLPPAPLSVPPPPSVPPARSTLTALDESAPASLLPDDDVDEGPLPQGEAGATHAAYSCIRQGVPLGDLKRQIERDCVARALAETKGNITRAAALLGMKRPRLSQLVKQYGLAAVSEGSS